jgi:hypothetical protein
VKDSFLCGNLNYMANKNQTGTMTLPSRTAVAVWNNELCGQISDGMWENSGPRDHWKFWCDLDVVFGDTAGIVKTSGMCRKTSYNFAGLYDIVGDRMLAYGRMAKAGAELVSQFSAASYMPETLEEFRECKLSGKWQYDFVATYMTYVTDELAVAFYASEYTMKDLRADIKLIKTTMKMLTV